MDSVPIPRLVRRARSVSAELAAHLERLIANGELAPGSRLPPERDLAAEMGVSRASLREAMFELESKNLIERRQGRGSRVVAAPAGATLLRAELAAVDIEIANAIELRDIVEPRIAGFAAQRVAESNLLQLDEVLAQSNENLSADESFRLDKEFHLLLAQATQNPLLVTLCAMATDWTQESRSPSHATRAARRVSIEGHKAIYEAVASRDADAAFAAMEKHLQDVRNIITSATR